MDLSIVIVNYNTCDHLRNCLDSLFLFTGGLKFEIIVVDNNSPDRTIEKFPSEYLKAKFLFREVNDGFGSGCNYGANHAEGKYVLFVNPDITISDDVNLRLFNFMETHPDAAVVSPVYIEDGSTIIYTKKGFPGYNWEFSEAFGNVISDLVSRIFKRKYVPGEFFEVNWVMGSYMFIRTNVFRQVQGFDENFFLYYEDIDLQFRIRELGFKVFYYYAVTVEHKKRSSVRTYSGENLYYYHMTRSNLIYMYKHFGFIKRNICRMFHLEGIVIRLLTLPFRKSYSLKRKQKLNQYAVKLKQFLSSKESIYRGRIFRISQMDDNRKQIVNRDSFWQ